MANAMTECANNGLPVPENPNALHIIMVIPRCNFSGELIALSYKKNEKNNNNSGVNIELGKTYRLKALRMMQIKKMK